MSGPLWQLYAIMLVNNTLGILTATMVFTRVIVERFDAARGFALSVMLSSSPLVARHRGADDRLDHRDRGLAHGLPRHGGAFGDRRTCLPYC